MFVDSIRGTVILIKIKKKKPKYIQKLSKKWGGSNFYVLNREKIEAECRLPFYSVVKLFEFLHI
jgi:Mor family transcriptional regulator